MILELQKLKAWTPPRRWLEVGRGVLLGLIAAAAMVAVPWRNIVENFSARQGEKDALRPWIESFNQRPLSYLEVALSRPSTRYVARPVVWEIEHPHTGSTGMTGTTGGSIRWIDERQVPLTSPHTGPATVVARIRWVYPEAVLLEYLGTMGPPRGPDIWGQDTKDGKGQRVTP